MKRIVAALGLSAALASPAQGAGYDDFTRGMSALSAGKSNAAITAFTAALRSGDLAPAYVPTARVSRARAYLDKQMCAEALADVNEAMTLSPGVDDMVFVRIAANACLKNADAVEADFATLIAKHPGAAMIRALADYQWRLGVWAKAAANYKKAWEIADRAYENRSYLAIWYAITAARDGGTPDADFLAKAEVRADGWTESLLHFFRGTIDEAKLFDEAKAWKDQTTKEQVCEANFYVAEWRLVHGDAIGAKPLLQKAAADCPKCFAERATAKTELKRQYNEEPADDEK